MSTDLPIRDKPLFTPGPLTTSGTVKQAMLRDLGSRDDEFITVVNEIRDGLLRLAGVSQEGGFEAVPMQGSGTFAIESVISSVTPPEGRWLVVVNGAYGERMVEICRRHRIDVEALRFGENQVPDVEQIEDRLTSEAAITHVAIVHCETTSGIMNPIEEVGQVVSRHQRVYFVDSMSAFGGVPFDFAACHIDYLVSSANKCIEGVPGFGFVICRRDALIDTAGWSRTVSLDLLSQLQALEQNGQFRFTPPTQAMLAFRQALRELDAEGGIQTRAVRYRANHACAVAGMRELGVHTFVPAELQGHIITAFLYPDDPAFEFAEFYQRLHHRGFVIYPGKLSETACFRIGHIGRLVRSDTEALLAAIKGVLEEMGVNAAAAPASSAASAPSGARISSK